MRHDYVLNKINSNSRLVICQNPSAGGQVGFVLLHEQI